MSASETREVAGWQFTWYGERKDYDFDYVTAFMELCRSGWAALPADVRQLAEDTVEIADGLQQKGGSGDMEWPDVAVHPEFYHRFENIPAEILCRAARVVYFFGHWFSRPILRCDTLVDEYGKPLERGEPWWSQLGRVFQAGGGHWKFALYADAVLRRKCGLEKRPEYRGRTCRFEVHEGMLRLCYSSRDCWMWQEVGLATQSTLERCRKAISQHVLRPIDAAGEDQPERKLDSEELHEKACAVLRQMNRGDDFVDRWLSTDRFKFGAMKGADDAQQR